MLNEKNQVLMQDRRNITKRGEHRGFFGGHVEEGESFEQAIHREIKEELDMDLNLCDCKLFCYLTRPNKFKDGVMNEVCVFVCRTDKQEHEFNVLEGDGCKYFDLEELKTANILDSNREIIDNFQYFLNNGYLD